MLAQAGSSKKNFQSTCGCHVQVGLGIMWCWHVHNFEIFHVNNVCIHYDCIQMLLPTNSLNYGQLYNCALTGHAHQEHPYSLVTKQVEEWVLNAPIK